MEEQKDDKKKSSGFSRKKTPDEVIFVPVTWSDIPEDERVPAVKQAIDSTKKMYGAADQYRLGVAQKATKNPYGSYAKEWGQVGEAVQTFSDDYSENPPVVQQYLENLYGMACSGYQNAGYHVKRWQGLDQQLSSSPPFTTTDAAICNTAQEMTTAVLDGLRENPAFKTAAETWDFGKKVQKKEDLERLLKEIDEAVSREFSYMWETYESKGELRGVLFPSSGGLDLLTRVLDVIAPEALARIQTYAQAAEDIYGPQGARIIFTMYGYQRINPKDLPIGGDFHLLNTLERSMQVLQSKGGQEIKQLDHKLFVNVANYLSTLQNLLKDLLLHHKKDFKSHDLANFFNTKDKDLDFVIISQLEKGGFSTESLIPSAYDWFDAVNFFGNLLHQAYDNERVFRAEALTWKYEVEDMQPWVQKQMNRELENAHHGTAVSGSGHADHWVDKVPVESKLLKDSSDLEFGKLLSKKIRECEGQLKREAGKSSFAVLLIADCRKEIKISNLNQSPLPDCIRIHKSEGYWIAVFVFQAFSGPPTRRGGIRF